jgi:hypothetical protein
LTATATLTYSYQIDQNLDRFVGIDHTFELTGSYSDTGQIVQIAPGQQYTLTVQYTDGEVDQLNENLLALYTWEGNNWVKEPSSRVDASANTVTAMPHHLSLWSVLWRQVEVYLPLVLKN